MRTTILLVGLGGAIGSIMRYLTTCFIVRKMSHFPDIYGTFTVNVIGCLVIGIVYGLSERHDWFSPQLRYFLATGICGGYTTFSAFAYENIHLLQQGHLPVSLAYAGISIIVCLFATFIGFSLTKMML